MTKSFFGFLVVGFLFTSCGKKESSSLPDFNAVQEPSIEAPVKEEPAIANTARIAEGKTLLEGTDCLTCHKTDEKLIGPSYLEIAQRYENTPENLELLAGKIIDGGSGVWGTVPMSAHPGMSRENAKKMVEYILSLNVK